MACMSVKVGFVAVLRKIKHFYAVILLRNGPNHYFTVNSVAEQLRNHSVISVMFEFVI